MFSPFQSWSGPIFSNVPEAASLRSRLGEGAKVPQPQPGVLSAGAASWSQPRTIV